MHFLLTIEESLTDYVIYDAVVPNPTTAVMEKGKDIYNSSHCDSLIAVGGGSAMDSAKAIGALVVNKNKTLGKMKGILKVRHKIPLLIAIPTTAGTGSEATLAAVVVDALTRREANPLYPVPQLWGKKELESIYYTVADKWLKHQ